MLFVIAMNKTFNSLDQVVSPAFVAVGGLISPYYAEWYNDPSASVKTLHQKMSLAFYHFHHESS